MYTCPVPAIYHDSHAKGCVFRNWSPLFAVCRQTRTEAKGAIEANTAYSRLRLIGYVPLPSIVKLLGQAKCAELVELYIDQILIDALDPRPHPFEPRSRRFTVIMGLVQPSLVEQRRDMFCALRRVVVVKNGRIGCSVYKDQMTGIFREMRGAEAAGQTGERHKYTLSWMFGNSDLEVAWIWRRELVSHM